MPFYSPKFKFPPFPNLYLNAGVYVGKLHIASSPLTPAPGTLKYLCALPGPLQNLIPEDVTPEKLEAARQAAPPPFIKLDRYNALMEMLGGRGFEQFEVQGSGMGIKVFSRYTRAAKGARERVEPEGAVEEAVGVEGGVGVAGGVVAGVEVVVAAVEAEVAAEVVAEEAVGAVGATVLVGEVAVATGVAVEAGVAVEEGVGVARPSGAALGVVPPQ
ncbi:unnamed protein product [Closterium sp. NIES-64]|nr:unnamed protein product [Closterium sp. NIES-64]